MFYLLDQPTQKEFQDLAQRYREMDPSSVKATVTLLRVGSDLLTGFETLLRRYGLSQGRFLILIVMNREPDKLTRPSILAEQIGVTRATMTGLIEGLARDGLVQRIPHGNDRRKMNLKLTPGGKDVLETLLPDYWSRIHHLMDGLTGNEQMTLTRLLEKVAQGIPELNRE
ncbi:MarR family winged helix-turn-helix transcriptional regulator [Desulfospira joergensenii]|uniref:MarR family winged helix-turn-helix transcriptional regulator n=1 Tax=Desulfospira joergensenii TaxID=53329 RepID=UPI0003B3746A|nr:MarR family transcriptional regulator [Desulfospira joergensenii]